MDPADLLALMQAMARSQASIAENLGARILRLEETLDLLTGIKEKGEAPNGEDAHLPGHHQRDDDASRGDIKKTQVYGKVE